MPAQALLNSTRSYLAAINNPLVSDFITGLDWSMEERPVTPRALPCLVHLDQSLVEAGKPEQELVQLIVHHARSFAWGQTYKKDDFDEAFLRNYGWIELFGTRGHFRNSKLAGGFLLLGSNIVYPDHHHLAEEIYIPLTDGTEWRSGNTSFIVRNAGEVIHHASNLPHAMRTNDRPLLALYLWRGGPLDQRSVIGS